MGLLEIAQVVGTLIAFGSILFLAVVCTKLFARKAKRSMKGSYINVIESLSLGLDKQIHLLKVGDQFVLIATAGKSVEYLTTLKLEGYDEQNEPSQENSGIFDFKSIFEKYIQTYKNRKRNIEELDNLNEEIQGGTGTDAFKKNLSKLRTITSPLNGNRGKLNDGDDNTNEE